MINQIYFVSAEDLEGITLYHAHISFYKNGFLEIEYNYDKNVNDEVKQEAEWFDEFTYELEIRQYYH